MGRQIYQQQIVNSNGVNNMTGTATVLSTFLNMSQVDQGSLEIQQTGSPTGTLTLEQSDAYDPINNPNAVWQPLPAGGVTPALTTAAAAGVQILVYQAAAIGVHWLRLKYVNASGTGQLNVYAYSSGRV